MEANKVKNTLILRNLPSNLIDEAIVILKNNKKIRDLDYIEKSNKKETSRSNLSKGDCKEYIIREAEMVISKYVSDIEEEKTIKKKNIKKLEIKYKKAKTACYILTIMLIVNIVFTIIK